MVFQLDDEIWFPNPRDAEPDGLLAVGGDLSVDRLLLAYSHGIFPWFDYREEDILWWCPKDRFVIIPKDIHISHSMRQMMRSGRYEVTIDQAFDQVITGCSKVNGRCEQQGAWLGGNMIQAYTELNKQGFCHSFEVWDKGPKPSTSDGTSPNADDSPIHPKLIGGLYGINIGSNFFGESMFSLAPSASKLALIALAQVIGEAGGIIDCQFETSHLLSMGGRHITYDEYMERLQGQPNSKEET